ncbi:MAG: transcription antitermination factor NusB, partial [Pseudomonadota bacterium]
MVEIQRRAAHIVSQVLSGRSLDAELRTVAAAQPDLSGPDRAALQDVVYGTLRFLGQIDAVLNGLLTRPLKDDDVRLLLRVALYQLIGTRAAAHAVVDHAVRTCVALGKPAAKGLVNGVLRNFLRNREAVLSVADETEVGRYSYPQWWIDKLRTQYPEHYREMLEAGNRHPPLTVRVNRRRASVAQYLARVKEAGIDAHALGGDAII